MISLPGCRYEKSASFHCDVLVDSGSSAGTPGSDIRTLSPRERETSDRKHPGNRQRWELPGNYLLRFAIVPEDRQSQTPELRDPLDNELSVSSFP